MAKSDRKPLQSVNIHLLKSEITDPEDAIAIGKRVTDLTAQRSVLPAGRLFFEKQKRKDLAWRTFLRPAFGNELPNFQSLHASAVLFFEAGPPRSKRVFAVTFGYGRSLLDDASLVADFGLRTALNLCNPDTLRAVNYRTIEERTRIGRVQLSDAGSVDAFRMNFDTDLLRGLEATSRDPSVCEQLGARWSNLIVGARIDVAELPALAAKLLREYRKTTLPEEYKWIENVRRETDPQKIRDLDKTLENLVADHDVRHVRLALPEIAGSTVGLDAKLFHHDGNGVDFTSDFADYLSKRPQSIPWTVSTAKHSHRVFLMDSATGEVREKIPLHRCIVAEVDAGSDHCLLVDGEWFCLKREFVNEVNAAIARIPKLKHAFSPWVAVAKDNKPQREEDWCSGVCNGSPNFVHFDQKNIVHGGARSKIEVADILSNDGVWWHAKRRDKSSSGLSHLFSQAFVAAQLLKGDPAFRAKVAAKIPKPHAPLVAKLNGQFDSRDWTIAYVILGGDPKDPAGDLPFFSKVNLRGAAKQIDMMGYKYGIVGV